MHVVIAHQVARTQAHSDDEKVHLGTSYVGQRLDTSSGTQYRSARTQLLHQPRKVAWHVDVDRLEGTRERESRWWRSRLVLLQS